MNYKINKKQSDKLISFIEDNLKSYFSEDERICGFKVYLNDDENPEEMLDVYILLNKNWVDTDDWSNLRTGYITDNVKKYLKDLTPVTFGVYHYAKKCE
jgi:hypothetical protein